MKILFSLCFVLFLSACSTTKFDKNVNCSPRALSYLNNDTKSNENAKSQKYEDGLKLMKTMSPDLQKCYQEMLDSGTIEQYNLCTVININEKGKISFIDIDDHSTTLNPSFYKCVVKKFEAFDFSKFQSATIVTPFSFYSRKI